MMSQEFVNEERMFARMGEEEVLLQDWPTPTVQVMGQLAVGIDSLVSRNDLASRASNYQPVIVHFGVHRRNLEMNSVRKNFSGPAARLMGLLLLKDPGQYTRSELVQHFNELFGKSMNHSRASLGEASLSLRYARFNANGSILTVEDDTIGLRSDLVFLPSVEPDLRLIKSVDIVPRGERKMPQTLRETTYNTRLHLGTNQYYWRFWPNFTPNSTKNDREVTQGKNKQLRGQQKFELRDKSGLSISKSENTQKPEKVPRSKTPKFKRLANKQLFIEWWPDYVPSTQQVEELFLPKEIELFEQPELVLTGEHPNGQGYYFFENIAPPSQAQTETGLELAKTSLMQPYPQPKLNFRRRLITDEEGEDELNTAKAATEIAPIMRNTDEFTEVAMQAAFDYIFNGGELPVVTDMVTFNAFQKAIQEIGGSDAAVSLSRVTEHYLGKGNNHLSSESRARINKLGESIHFKEGVRVPQKSYPTPLNLLTDADLSWYAKAACKGMDPDYFHPSEGDRDSVATMRALEACKRCKVREECLDFALDTNQRMGIWGGMFDNERRAEKRRRKKQQGQTF